MTLPRSSYIVISTSLAFDRPLIEGESELLAGCVAGAIREALHDVDAAVSVTWREPKSPAEFDVALGCEASGNG